MSEMDEIMARSKARTDKIYADHNNNLSNLMKEYNQMVKSRTVILLIITSLITVFITGLIFG